MEQQLSRSKLGMKNKIPDIKKALETISFIDFIENDGEKGAKESGKLKTEGKEYIVQDGDVLHFLFNS